MSGLMLKLAPGERFFINGTLLENGDKPGRIRVPGPDVMVLRCRDALAPIFLCEYGCLAVFIDHTHPPCAG